MLGNIIKKAFGTRNERLLKGYSKIVSRINALEPEIQALSDADLRAKTDEFKKRLVDGEGLDALLPEAFAVVRETSVRTLGLRHFDVQIIGGLALHGGKIAEMRTGEGKTLGATMPAYLNALTGKGVHIVTVNDYLAKRDAEWMKPIYEFLGLTVGVNVPGMEPVEKQAAYAADITYGTNNEFGFDYLRDNMVFDLDQRVQRPLHYAIIDEVDSILIDEARTPLIISGQAEESSDLYVKINKFIPQLKLQKMEEGQKEEEVPPENRGDYTLDEKNRQAYLTEQGHRTIEALMIKQGLMQAGESLYDVSNISLMHYVYAALRAHTLFYRDVHYIVKNNEVIIVDEHTGRLMPGRRWSDGLHQAVEAKEGATIQLENQTLATITFQNYFRLYEKLSGMTATADTEAFELQKIYGLEVVVIPTNRPMIRRDESDQVYLTADAKFDAIVNEVKKRHEKGQPLLIGTASIEASELVARFLKKANIKHEILNAKNHEREAKIIAEAGRPGAVTIATNMAGRGTDIVLGGNLEAEMSELDNLAEEEIQKRKADWQKRHDAVIAAGGLHVLGTERHESRRIDNQLRGRSGRQGDPGSSQFYLSMEDNLLRIFAAERMSNMMRRLGVKEDDVIEHPWITRAIEKAQRRVEGMNFDIRKQLLEYDDVANDQRKVIYQQRFQLLQTDDISETIEAIREEAVSEMISSFVPPQSLEEEWDIPGLEKQIREDFGLALPIAQWLEKDETLHEETLHKRIIDEITKAYKAKEAKADPKAMREVEKTLMLQLLDHHWKEHLAAMDHLRQGIHLRGYAQKNPAQEYKRESFELFTQMLKRIKYELAATLSKLEIATEEQVAQQQRLYQQSAPELQYHHAEMTALQPEKEVAVAEQEEATQPFVRSQPKVGRNESCPCGSGKKYKQCHGKLS
ncbi:preprotein translocase subunit SecA [Coxiella burnetii]|uniref:Protein translocase subunit SecA n=2 Tax=Coxiella burnetii (strain RSA 493 / Nine Mile phase I) TaxID=227377 RepID=SECA_COXBU|nr:preprotein translocase subunit SecA [Coxiella burnetii]Q83F06.1 RecName: Full=Protein translocase subunit SecA [Coxiella burnetii RSA 493]ABX77996.1 preprotein translocase, SecA subunit [Coxiella burnetii RSA 331]AML49743.1 preprotein translocase subunit SecA [Coxiella burnetii]AML55641.1 preprotein translocase subunit SecA [Coxiella burnetii]ARK28273.1 preprotein translocase subunit SecA [Coxiella burnetii]ATN69622.1 preprotein translocase subunit SecA [Coxiella burnetii]